VLRVVAAWNRYGIAEGRLCKCQLLDTANHAGIVVCFLLAEDMALAVAVGARGSADNEAVVFTDVDWFRREQSAAGSSG
jgi:hypothetical protein